MWGGLGGGQGRRRAPRAFSNDTGCRLYQGAEVQHVGGVGEAPVRVCQVRHDENAEAIQSGADRETVLSSLNGGQLFIEGWNAPSTYEGENGG